VAIAVGATGRRAAISNWALPAAAVVGCAVIAILINLTYRFAEPIGRISGQTALSIISRLSSFILLCIGVQTVWNGASALLKTLL
jgi:multiple antibiotic resistance protein